MSTNLFLDLFVNLVLLGGLYTLIAIGLNLQYGLTRVLNVAYGDFMILAGYITYWLFTLYAIDPPFSIAVSFPLMVCVGLVLYRVVLRRLFLIHEKTENLEGSSILVAFGLSYIIQNLIILLWSGQMRSYNYLPTTIQLLSTFVPINRILIFGIAISVSLVCYFFLKYTLTGKAMRATMQQRFGAATLGIDTFKMYGLSFSLGLGMSGVSGSLVSMIYNITPSSGLPFTYTGFIMVVLGGLGNLLGSVIAAYVVAAVQVYSAYLASPGIAELVIFVALVFILAIRPQGLLRG